MHSPGSVSGSLDMDFYFYFYYFKFCTGDIGDIAKDTIWREYRKLRKPVTSKGAFGTWSSNRK